MSNFSNRLQQANPKVYHVISQFFTEKDLSDFILEEVNDSFVIKAKFPKADAASDYQMDISTAGCEFSFNNQNAGLHLEVLNEFENFDEYFVADKNHGSAIARLLRNDYREKFAEQIASGSDLELDEDFNVYFIDNFVNYILNDVYYE